MKFHDKLDVALQRGFIQAVGDLLFVPRNVDMRLIMPSYQSPKYTTFCRAMLRGGYVYKRSLGAWLRPRQMALNMRAQRRHRAQTCCCRR